MTMPSQKCPSTGANRGCSDSVERMADVSAWCAFSFLLEDDRVQQLVLDWVRLGLDGERMR